MIYPKGETVWLEARNAQGEILYIVTSPSDRRIYKIYTPEPDGSWKLWGKHTSAGQLAERFEMRRV